MEATYYGRSPVEEYRNRMQAYTEAAEPIVQQMSRLKLMFQTTLVVRGDEIEAVWSDPLAERAYQNYEQVLADLRRAHFHDYASHSSAGANSTTAGTQARS
jgi:hypothetical protein